jgi:ferredoxin--NADP+ reductase
MSDEAKFTQERILSIRPWAPNLFSFTVSRAAGFSFVPGQFARLGVPTGGSADAPWVWRAYSMASPPADPDLEFFSIVVPGGEFSTALARLRVGDALCVERTNYGFLTLDRFEPGRDLWMLATGTGLAPFLSMLADGAVWRDYERVVLVHSVRYANELAYADRIRSLGGGAPGSGARLLYVPVVTRRKVPGVPAARIPALLDSGELENHAGVRLEPDASRVLICGNPDMVSAARKLLAARGFATSRRARPGQMAVENYW